jgi:hypothetical protein
MADRLLRAHRTLLLVPIVDVNGVSYLLGGTQTASIIAPLSAPTAAVLNTWVGVNDNSLSISGVGGNISCAVLDNVDIGLSDSDTDDEQTVCSQADESDPTFYNVDASITFQRDESLTASNVRNLAWNLLKGKGVRYAIIDRAWGEYTSTDLFVAGQKIDIYEIDTDNLLNETEDQATIKGTQNSVPTGVVLVNGTVAA